VARRSFDELSLRSVAHELEVTPMALYRHVADAGALVALVTDDLAHDIPLAVPTGAAVTDLATWARSARAALSGYPGLAAHLLTTWFAVPRMLVQVEQLLAVTEQITSDDFEQVAAANAVLMFVLMRVEAESGIRRRGVLRRSLRLAAAGAPVERLHRLYDLYATADLDGHFDYGLEVLLKGIGARGPAC
jgi:TetR/AcrR family tetracycline transcriptional repressor